MERHPLVPDPTIYENQQPALARIGGLMLSHPWPLLLLIVGVFAPLTVFGALADEVWSKEGFGWDTPIQLAVHNLATPARDQLAELVTNLGGPVAMAIVIVLLAAFFMLRKHTGHAVFVILAAGGAMLVDAIAKIIFHRARPHLWPWPYPVTDASFPSGHAMGSIAVVATIVILLWHTRWRWPAIGLGAVFAFAVGLSRVYLGVHYPSDILGAWMAGLAWVVGMQLVWSYWNALHPKTDYNTD